LEKSLKVLRPDLASEWDYEKNKIIPEDVSLGSNKKVWWKCKYGHSWNEAISNRCRGRGCPYCSGRRVSELKYIADGKLIRWWDSDNDCLPHEVSLNSNKIVKWICPSGHKFEKSVCSMVKNTRCRNCGRAYG
jgi:hypothetical protein